MKKFKCRICGYIHEIEELPDDFKCPICGVGVELFDEIFEEKNKEEKYQCPCGYIHNDIEFTEGFICPLCGRDYKEFEEKEVSNIVLEVDKRVIIEDINPAIARIESKCINCGLCKKICTDQVGINYDYEKTKKVVCVGCGQCVLSCPVGALVPKYNYQAVKSIIDDEDKIVIALTSPAVRVALGEEFQMEAGSFVEKKMVAALRNIGVDYVFDTAFGADLTVMEEASEFVRRLKEKKNLPQFTSCCPAWVKYLEIYYPEFINHLSTCKSPISMQTTMIKTYFAKTKNINPEKIVTVALTPCTAKKAEIARSEFNSSGHYFGKDIKDTDYVITTSEFALMLREEKIDFKNLEDSEFDSMFARGSGAGVIFGNSGGVTEAAIRTVNYLITGNSSDKKLLNFEPVRGMDGIKEAELLIEDLKVKVAVVHGLTNAKKLLEKLKNKELEYDFIEVMNCPGGCIGGGGQPLTVNSRKEEILKARMASLYNADEVSVYRNAHDNEDIKKIYDDFLGQPLSELSEELLHTSYEDKSSILES